MPSAGRTEYTIAADARQAMATMQQFQRSVADMERGAVSSFQNVGQAAQGSSRGLQAFQGAAIAAGGALSAVLLPALFLGYQRMTTIENATASLTRQMDSATKATGFLGEILETVKGTPFNLDQFADAASLLVRMNVEADKVPGYMTAIGEAAAGGIGDANQNVSQLSQAFARVAAMGRATGETIQSLELTGVPVIQMLKSAGHEVDNTNRNFAKLNLSAEEFFDIVTKGIMEGGEGFQSFAGSMADLRENLEGAVGGFKAALARIGATFFGALQGEAKSLAGAIQSISEVIDERVIPSLEKLVAPIAKAIESFQKGGGFKRIIDQFSNLAGIAPLLGGAMGVAAAGMLKFGGTLPLIGPLIAPFARSLGFIPLAIAGVLVATEEGRTALGRLAEVFKKIGSDVGPALAQLAASFASAFGSLVSAISPLLKLVTAIPAPVLQFVAVMLLVRKAAEVLPAIFGQWVAKMKLGVLAMQEKARAGGLATVAMTSYQRSLEATMAKELALRASVQQTNLALMQRGPAAAAAGGATAMAGAAGLSGVGATGSAGFTRGFARANIAPQAAKATTALTGLKAASAGAMVGLKGVVALLGGPVGIAIGVAVVSFMSIKKAMADVAEEAKKLNEQFVKGLGIPENLDEAEANFKSLANESKRLRAELARLEEAEKDKGGIAIPEGLQEPIEKFFAFLPGPHRAEEFVKLRARIEDINDPINEADEAVKKFREDAKKTAEDEALEKVAEDARALNKAMQEAISTIAGVFTASIQEFEAQEAKLRAEQSKLTRSVGDYIGALNLSERAQSDFSAKLSSGTLSAKELAAAQRQLVEAMVRSEQATTNTSITESEMFSIRENAKRQVADITRREVELRRERERANFTLITSFRLLEDSVMTLEKLRGRGEEAAAALAPDPSVAAAYGRVGDEIGSLLDEFESRTKKNAAVLKGFVGNVNFLAKQGHEAFASSLAAMGVEGADLAKEAVERIKSGQGLGSLSKVMGEAAKAAKLTFDERATRWGPNFKKMAEGAVGALAPVIADELPGIFESGTDLTAEQLARFTDIFDKNIEEHGRWTDTVNGLANNGMVDLAAIIQTAGPAVAKEALALVKGLEGTGGFGSLNASVKRAVEKARQPFVEALETYRNPGVAKAKDVGKASGEALVEGVNDALRSTNILSGGVLNTGSSGIFGWLKRNIASPVGNFFSNIGNQIAKVLVPYHEGGRVAGSLGQNVPIMAQAGEWVLSREQVKRIGEGSLERFHSGGRVGGGDGGSMGGASVSITVNGPVIGSGYEDLTEAVRAGLTKTQFRNADIGVRGASR